MSAAAATDTLNRTVGFPLANQGGADFPVCEYVDGCVLNQYDHQDRRVASRSEHPLNTAYERTFVYDGWNLVAEIEEGANTSSVSTNLFVLGKDLSGATQGAGGVGGLLATRMYGNWYFPLYDNNGNVTEYLDASGNVVAQYRYDAFGLALRSSGGALASAFRHRFSTKNLCAYTGLYYYGYRFYDPYTGRFTNRDPIEEQGGLNLYAFCANDAVNRWDYLGLSGLIKILSYESGRRYNGFDFGGTSWIEYTPSCNRELSLGENGNKAVIVIKSGTTYHIHLYGNLNGPQKKKGVNISSASDYQGISSHSRGAWIDGSAEQRLWQYIKDQRDLGEFAWTLINNCATFAANAWNTATGENIDPSNGMKVSDVLSESQLDDYMDSLGIPPSLRKTMKPMIMSMPMNTPKNLAAAIYAQNGNKTYALKGAK